MKTPHLYLAGPEVFRPDAAAAGKRLKQIAQRAGAEGVFPLDGEPVHDAEAIKRRCSEMIDAADAVVANITPFRGHHMDPGTAWEIGYAEARGKPVHLWSNDPRPLRDRIPAGVELDADGWRDDDGHLVEDFELAENLMIAADAGPVWETAEKGHACGRR
ncbi:nucleoside 2-deoxyribosyltransferase [Ancylobacter dichloromethanicus]